MKNIVWLWILLTLVGCGRSDDKPLEAKSEGPHKATSLAVARGYVDSALPIEEALRRFRSNLPEPKRLSGGFQSREKLVRAFVAALETRDTSALGRMAIGAAEFAWFYYPSSPLSRPPYELPPALVWFQQQGESEKGAARLLAERAGSALGYVGHTCAPARVEGENHIHSSCELRRVTGAGDTIVERLFGLIVERGGAYKFVSYANEL